MQRSLIERSLSIVDLPDSFKLTIPDIIQSDLGFENSKYSILLCYIISQIFLKIFEVSTPKFVFPN